MSSVFSSNCTSFTAHEWKLWTLLYSTYILEGILPAQTKIWTHFVIGCQHICKAYVTSTQIKLSCVKLCEYGRLVALEYGANTITPKHAQTHSSWGLYAFERYNGILSNIPANHHSIEVQSMKWFFPRQILSQDECVLSMELLQMMKIQRLKAWHCFLAIKYIM